MAERKQLTLSLKGGLAIFCAALLIGLIFNYFGKQDLERPTGVSIFILVLAVAMRWELRRHLWFWTTTAIFVVLHVLLILFIPWPTGWIPAMVMTPIGLADLYVMLGTVSLVGKFIEGPNLLEN